jgi:A/G-specific adenine glycosylase
MPGKEKQRRVVPIILRWYSRHGRNLPWRVSVGRQGQAGNTNDPYRILISEIMLQQTQVARVLVKYPEFLRRFPTFRSLAVAPQRDVVLAWRGMGYNNRAVRIHKLAHAVVAHHGGRLPSDYETLRALPGVGRYTANAILSSAYRQDQPVVDVNVRRVLSRLFWKMHSTQQLQDEQETWKLATRILPHGRAYRWNQALMDLGATICTARRPHCVSCPVRRICISRTSMTQDSTYEPKREPSCNGIPNRVYRGRIVETLRGLRKKQSILLDRLGRRVYPEYSFRQRKWLEGLVSRLQRDGLLRIWSNGSTKHQLVSLA